MARVAAAPAPVWLASSRFDVLAFFAPALLSLVAFLACVGLQTSPLVWLWFWILAFDAPHMLAAYTRVYGDALLWRTRKRLLLGSLAAFAVGPAVLLASAGLRVPGLFTAFLAGMSVYAFHHIVRQHWGFVSLYGARSGERAASSERWWLYLVCWAPYGAFVLTHPSLRQESYAPPALQQAATVAAFGLLVLWLLGTFWFVGRAVSAWRQGRALQKPAYLLMTALFHALLFFIVARYEPVFGGAVGLDQEFMLLGLMNGMFHSAQYVALVALYHQRSKQAGAASEATPTWFADRPARALLVFAPFVLVYGLVACATGVYPGCQLWLGSQLGPAVGVNQLALGIWWGFALQHYWLDERIWHVRSDPRLRHVFGLHARQAGS